MKVLKAKFEEKTTQVIDALDLPVGTIYTYGTGITYYMRIGSDSSVVVASKGDSRVGSVAMTGVLRSFHLNVEVVDATIIIQ